MLSLFKQKPEEGFALRLYDQMVDTARDPAFYTDFGVPDTLDGRFECITLHVFALMFRLKNETVEGAAADRLAQKLFDVMFRDMERNLREMGVGDLSVPKKMKAMMRAFNGRCHAYTLALKDNNFNDALRRNLYGTVPDIAPESVQAMGDYMKQFIGGMMARTYPDMVRAEFRKHEKAA